MKTCVKACLLTSIAFITLVTITMIVGYTIITKEGQFASEHHEPLGGMYHNPEAEGMIERMDHIAAEFDNTRVHDLDNHDDRNFLSKNGLIVEAGKVAQFKAVENPSTGYKW